MSATLPAALEVTALLRQVQSDGGFGTILRRGDADRGSIILVITSRGHQVAVLERLFASAGDAKWHRRDLGESPGSTQIGDFLAKQARFDADLWAVELDIADPERFIAELGAAG